MEKEKLYQTEDEKFILEDSLKQYITNYQGVGAITWSILGGKNFMNEKPVSALDLFIEATKGIPKRSVTALAGALGIPMKKMAHLLSISDKTLSRKKPDDLMDSLTSSLSVEIAQTIARGLEVFEDKDKFNRWLQKENRALRGKKPIDLLNTPTGIKLVNQVLGRIEYGVYS